MKEKKLTTRQLNKAIGQYKRQMERAYERWRHYPRYYDYSFPMVLVVITTSHA